MNSREKNGNFNLGIIFCSGLIAGEALNGILVAILTILGYNEIIDLSEFINLKNWGTLFSIIIISYFILYFSFKKIKKIN